MRNLLTLCLVLLCVAASNAGAFGQARNLNAGGGTGIGANLPNVGGNNAAATGQEINENAGTSASVERDFGNGFIGRSDSAGEFVGNEQAGPQQQNAQRPNFQQRNNGNTRGGQPTRQSQVRPVIRIGFDWTGLQQSRSSMSPGSANQEVRLQRQLNLKPTLNGVQITRQSDGKLALTGIVPTPRDRKLAEIYLKLEPGVNEINNQLTILPNP